MKQYVLPLLFLALGNVACETQDSVAPAPALSATLDAKGGALAVPQLSCGNSTKTSVEIVVTAGATGAPAGFSLHWMPLAQYQANGGVWPSNESQLCKASFSGNARDSRYELSAGQSVRVRIGDLLLDNGASSSCTSVLTCGQAYVFRVFAHAEKSASRSEFSGTFTCSTLPCIDVPVPVPGPIPRETPN